MTRTLTIDPVTRIEGHAKITLELDEADKVKDARFHVTQFRGFEKFCEGRPFREMPGITARTCGICPVSHLIAGSKACDDILAVRIPESAENLRRVLNLAQIMQSHALSFFHLSSPDMLLGWDSDPADRNVFGVMVNEPQMAKDGIRLRQIGQSVIELMSGKRIHPAWVVPGGVSQPLSEENRDTILSWMPEALGIATRTLDWFKGSLDKFEEEISVFANFPSMHMGTVDKNGNLEHYDGVLRIIDADGNIVENGITPEEYPQKIAEAVESYSYMKFPYYIPQGYPDGMYRVGPLARLNVANQCGTEIADRAFKEFRQRQDGPISSSFLYHYARLIEIIFAAEKITELLSDPAILTNKVRAFAQGNRNEGIGISEAPRGTLIHHYQVDDDHLITGVNLVIATGHNNLAMNRGILQAAQHFVKGARLEEGMLNRVEAVIRCYDPCLSCATHAVGQMPMEIQLVSPEGRLLDSVFRR